jgi:hypothetical protein
MSNASSTTGDGASGPSDGPSSGSAALRTALVPPLRFVSFWAAVGLPLLYVPLLWGGLGEGEASLFLGLVLLNALALVAGHRHGE